MDTWDNDHVRMPCSSRNTFLVKDEVIIQIFIQEFKMFIVMCSTGNVSLGNSTLTLLSTINAKQKTLADSNQLFKHIYFFFKQIGENQKYLQSKMC